MSDTAVKSVIEASDGRGPEGERDLRSESDPSGCHQNAWEHARDQAIAEYYDNLTDDEAAAETEAAFSNPLNAVMRIPAALVPAVQSIWFLLPDRVPDSADPTVIHEVNVPEELPPDWSEARVEAIIAECKAKTESEAIAELEAAPYARPYAVFVFPKVLRPYVERLLAECAHLDPKKGRLGRWLRRRCWLLTPRRWKERVANRLTPVAYRRATPAGPRRGEDARASGR